MKTIYKLAALPIALLLMAATNQQPFVLTTADHQILGKGAIEITDNSMAQATVLLEGVEFTGAGNMYFDRHAYVSEKRKLGVRLDRAIMAASGQAHKKQTVITLNSQEGVELACTFKPNNTYISGQCVNTNTQQTLTIQSPTEAL